MYADFLGAVPAAMRHLPVFLTEVGQAQPWQDRNNGWIQAMYAEIDAWNRQPGAQTIRVAALYRWPKLDRWYIAGKAGVEEDFRQALLRDYRWQDEELLEMVLPVAEEATAQASVQTPTPVSTQSPTLPPTSDTGAAPAAAVAVAATRTRRERRRQPPKPYAVEWLGEEFPARLLAGQILTVPVTIKNAGSLTWTWGGGNPVRLGYRYYRNRRPLPIPPTRDLRTDVPEDVAPGQTVVFEMHLALPEEPGNYTVELDFVHEGIAWFKEKGSTPLTRWLTVEAPAPEIASRRQVRASSCRCVCLTTSRRDCHAAGRPMRAAI